MAIVMIILLTSFAFSTIIVEFHLPFTLKDPVVGAIIFIDIIVFALFIITYVVKKQKH